MAGVLLSTLNCDYCGKTFTRTSSKMRSVSGFYFCCLPCKNKAQKIGSGFDEMMPAHYGHHTGIYSYRFKAFSILPAECVDCGETFLPLLQIHHVDGDRTNNPDDGTNWEILCNNHHQLRHMTKHPDGEWVRNTKKITPRECLPDILKLVKVHRT